MKLTQEHKERIKRYVEALRSGEYKQTDGTLRIGDRFCCLGVACEVFRKETQQGKWWNSNFTVGGSAVGSSSNDLPEPVAEYFFNNPNMHNPILDGLANAIYFNDIEKETFNQIAARFEAKYLKEDGETK